MGTRHYQVVITKEGDKKVQQFGQWDGYPEGQGLNILRYLKSGNLEKYQNELEKLREVTKEELKAIDFIDWNVEYPYLSRDCGSKIHQMIENGEVKFVSLCPEEEAGAWCEGFYTIDFQENVFISNYHGKTVTCKLNKLPGKKRYLNAFKDKTEINL